MKPICVPCRRFFRPSKTGRYFIEGMPATSEHAPPGTSAPEKWKPYKLWSGDEWECPDCGSVIICGVGRSPISEHFQDDFADKVKEFNPEIQVNDC